MSPQKHLLYTVNKLGSKDLTYSKKRLTSPAMVRVHSDEALEIAETRGHTMDAARPPGRLG